ncbi:VWA domain-containing protein [Streptomyces albus]|nr:VWA domain-containing protein [Streptomyces albus]
MLTAPAAAAEGPSREEIYRELGVADQPVDYAVLVDTSGSMRTKGRYDTVRSTLRGFLGGLSRSDHVALITFDDRPEARYVGSAGDPGKIVGRLPESPDPDGGTDIGAALDLALRELERSDAASVASVVLLTDGRHEPPRSTAYPKASGAPWDALHERAEAVGTRAALVTTPCRWVPARAAPTSSARSSGTPWCCAPAASRTSAPTSGGPGTAPVPGRPPGCSPRTGARASPRRGGPAAPATSRRARPKPP